jgi:hypothetical protein
MNSWFLLMPQDTSRLSLHYLVSGQTSLIASEFQFLVRPGKSRPGIRLDQESPSTNQLMLDSILSQSSAQLLHKLRNPSLQSELPIHSTILSEKLQQHHTDPLLNPNTQGRDKRSQGQTPPRTTSLTPSNTVKSIRHNGSNSMQVPLRQGGAGLLYIFGGQDPPAR